MGCHCSQAKEFEHEEETLITHFEQFLGFGSHAAGHICTQVQVLTVNEKLNWNRLRQLATVLNLNVAGLQSSEEPIARFYEALKTEKDWSTRQLSLLGVLLGQGSATTKASLLFHLYDQDYTGALPNFRIEEMLLDLCTLAFTHLPRFAQHMLQTQGDLDTSELLGSYINHLEEAKQVTARFLTHRLAEENTTVEDFEVRAQACKCIFSAKWLRVEGLAHYKSNIRTLNRIRASTI